MNGKRSIKKFERNTPVKAAGVTTQDEALALVLRVQTAVQKTRSNLIEAMGDDEAAMKVNEALQPWLFGDRCILRATEIVLARGQVTAGELYNLLIICNRPELRALLGMWFALNREDDLPEPDLALCMRLCGSL